MMNISQLAYKIGKPVSYIKDLSGLLVIGNGFDRDLKRTITFSDFYKSNYWPREEQLKCPLSSYLDSAHKEEQWFDLEEALSNYVDPNNSLDRDPKKDMVFYNHLVEGLSKYASSKTIETLTTIQEKRGRQVKEMPLAYLVLESILLSPFYKNIYSFNYTELDSLADLIFTNNRIDKGQQTKIAFSSKLEYTHGSLATKDIILGAKNESTYPGLELIRKTNKLKGTTIVDRLSKANQVVFFGHSLSSVDRCYFDKFFEGIADGSNQTCRKIIIITFNDESKLQIRNNLMMFYGIDWSCSKIDIYTIENYLNEVTVNQQLSILKEIEELSLG